jgi:hypothetical protein
MEGNEQDWKSRCGVLEEQLARFREQAAKVREVIGQKVKHSRSPLKTPFKIEFLISD